MKVPTPTVPMKARVEYLWSVCLAVLVVASAVAWARLTI